MGLFTKGDVARVKRHLPEVLESYGVELERHGFHIRVARCPLHIHEDNPPSFVVHLRKGTFYCFGCSSRGSAVDVVMARENATFAAAVLLLRERFPPHRAAGTASVRSMERVRDEKAANR